MRRKRRKKGRNGKGEREMRGLARERGETQ